MKTKICILSILCVLLLSGCVTRRKQEYFHCFSTNNNIIFYDTVMVAKFTHLEYEYYGNKKTIEISLDQLFCGATDMTEKIVEYVRSKHKNAKIELRIPQSEGYFSGQNN